MKQISPSVKVGRKAYERYMKCASCSSVATLQCFYQDKLSYTSCTRHVNGHLRKLVAKAGETATA